MSKYLSKSEKVVSSPALRRVRRNVYWQAGLAATTIILTIVIIFAMTAAWYTNIVQTSGLVFEAEAWGFEGQIIVSDQSIKAAPGDEGLIHLQVVNSADSMTAVGVSASKTSMETLEMRQRLYFYVDTQMTRNGETLERVYLNSLSNYTYMLFGNSDLTLTEDTHNDALLKWQWVYDVLGYYVLGSYDESTGQFDEIEYLRPVEYDYDRATYDYVTAADGTVTIELKTIDGETTVEEFLAELSETDGYEQPIDFNNPKAKGYYPVEVDEEGYGVYVYLCSVPEIEQATQYDTEMGQSATANNAGGEVPPRFPVTLTVSAQKNDANVIPAATLDALNATIAQLNGTTVQLSEDITLTGEEKIVIPEGSQVIVDLNGKTVKCETGGNAVEAAPGSSVIFINGTLDGAETGKGYGVSAVGAEVVMNNVSVTGFSRGINISDNVSDNTLDSKIRLVDCEVDGSVCALFVSGNGKLSEQKTQLIIEGSTLTSDNVAIYGNGDASGNGRWGTDIQIIDSTITGTAGKGSAGIYHPQKDSTMTIYNSVVSGDTGIAIKGGTVAVKGSMITGTGPALAGDPAPDGSGFVNTGDAIYIEANYGYDIRLEIDDAEVLDTESNETTVVTSEIISKNNYALRIWEQDATNVSVRIFSGKFSDEQLTTHIAAGSAQTQKDGFYIIAVDESQ